jgi:hypothetical protein
MEAELVSHEAEPDFYMHYTCVPTFEGIEYCIKILCGLIAGQGSLLI